MTKKFEELSRVQQSILLVTYRSHPMGMTQEEIEEAIYAEGLLHMSDEEFDKYHRDLINWKRLVTDD